MGVYASGLTPNIPTYPAIGDASAALYDILKFEVEAGSYADDVVATAAGYVSGFFSSTGGGNAFADFSAGFGAGSPFNRHWESGAVNESFSFPYILVNAGAVLDQPIVVEVPIHASLRGYATSSNISISSAEADFFARFTSVVVPDGVSWSSASNVFLIPEPSKVLLFGVGLAVLALIGRWKLKKNLAHG